MLELYQLNNVVTIDSIHAIYYSELSKNHKFTGERHEFWEILYVDKGYVIGKIEENNFMMEKGQFMLIKPNSFHDLYTNDKNASNILNISFNCENIKLYHIANRVDKLNLQQTNLLKILIAYIEIPLKDIFKVNLFLEMREHSKFYGKEQLLKNLLEVLLINCINEYSYENKIHSIAPIIDTDYLDKESATIVAIINSNINSVY